MEEFKGYTVNKLKIELKNLGAKTSGKKAELIDRLLAYRRNNNFAEPPVLLPETVSFPEWPSKNFRSIVESDRSGIPKIRLEHVEQYVLHRQASDKSSAADNKAIYRGNLMKNGSIQAMSCCKNKSGEKVFFSGIVAAAMKKKVTYNLKIVLSNIGEVQNSECDCPCGKGPHATCKHVTACLLLLVDFVEKGVLEIEKSSTENLQSFKKPKRVHNRSPVKCFGMQSSKLSELDEDPRLDCDKLDNYEDYKDEVKYKIKTSCFMSQTSFLITV